MTAINAPLAPHGYSASMDAIADPFAALTEEHAELTRLFSYHQEALLDRDWVMAARLLGSYRERLYRHMEIEERFVLDPARVPAAAHPRWTTELYRAEHRRVRLYLERVDEWLTRARHDGAPAGMLIGLLDRERTLKHLLEHHHHREEVVLFAHLRRSLPARLHAALGRALAEPASAAAP